MLEHLDDINTVMAFKKLTERCSPSVSRQPRCCVRPHSRATGALAVVLKELQSFPSAQCSPRMVGLVGEQWPKCFLEPGFSERFMVQELRHHLELVRHSEPPRVGPRKCFNQPSMGFLCTLWFEKHHFRLFSFGVKKGFVIILVKTSTNFLGLQKKES